MKKKPFIPAAFILLLTFLKAANSFVVVYTSKQTSRSRRFSSSDNNNNKNDDNNSHNEDDRMQQLRTLLEASWNQSLMGIIPTTPLAAAHEISQGILSSSSRHGGVSIIDLQLPSLDLRQGTRWYDAVLAADVAHLLVERLFQQQQQRDDDESDGTTSNALLLVRDEATVRTIERVWDTRTVSSTEDEQEEEEEEESTTIVYDDFADFGFKESIAVAEKESSRTSSSSSSELVDVQPQQTPNVDRRRIQLKSLFGDALVSEGADMEDKVIRALQANVVTHLKQVEALNKGTVDTIVMIAPITRPEVMAIRALVRTYSKNKRIILINPHFAKPRPMELQYAQTVYSLRPFLVRSKDSQERLTKIVVLKRQQEWELFLSNSANGQFERMAVNLPEGDAMDGPSMKWVAACAQQYLQQKNTESQ